MNEKTKEFRQQIVDAFIRSLTENPLTWQKEWKGLGGNPVNAINGKRYKGINRLWLSFVACAAGYTDSRWCTFKQITEKGWHLEKGSHATKVEYWMPYDKKSKKIVSWDDYKLAENQDDYLLVAKYYAVFNGNQIEGIPEQKVYSNPDVQKEGFIEDTAHSMRVELLYDGGDKAFYRPSTDSVHLPLPETFFSQYAYRATAFHELAHSTGHSSRLDRSQQSYAYEELVAEISSCFMATSIGCEMSEEHLENHRAYVQGWANEIKANPEVLMKAVKDAEAASDYLELHAGLTKEVEKENAITAPEAKVQYETKNKKRTSKKTMTR